MDSDSLKNSVRRIKLKSKLKNVSSKFVEIVSYYLTVFAIVQLKFFPDNKLAFNQNDKWSYIILAFCIFLIVFGTKNIYDDVKNSNEIIVDKNELHDLINYARYNASKSVINFAGDLSWLESDINEIELIKKEHPQVVFSVYYDKGMTSVADMNRIKQLSKTGTVNAVSYPSDNIVKARCMFVDLVSDYQLRDNSRVYVYQRCEDNTEKFIWQEFTNKDKVISNSIESIVGLLKIVKKPTIKVGFSGINNVGKTTLAEKCEELLSKHYDVKLYKDAFYDFEKKTDYDNMCILFEQLSNETRENEKINIFDRTIFDNYKYSYLRTDNNSEKNFNMISSLITDNMSKYDLIVYVNRKEEKFDFDTTHVTREERRRMCKEYEMYYSINDGLNTKTVFVDFDNFDKSIEDLSEEIVMEIIMIYEKKVF